MRTLGRGHKTLLVHIAKLVADRGTVSVLGNRGGHVFASAHADVAEDRVGSANVHSSGEVGGGLQHVLCGHLRLG